MKRLGVNIDHVATVRNARGEKHPDPLNIAIQAIKFGADSITIHLREDRRHIKDEDLKKISKLKIPLNLEIGCNQKMIEIALRNKPNFICLVPEKRRELTTEGGLNIEKNFKKLKYFVKKFKKKKIRTSLFVNPNKKDIFYSKKINTDCIEIHTGKISNLIKNKKNYINELKKIKQCAKYANSLGIEVHAGHGLDYKSTKVLAKIAEIREFNIGHFIIGEAISIGLKNVIKLINKIIKN